MKLISLTEVQADRGPRARDCTVVALVRSHHARMYILTGFHMHTLRLTLRSRVDIEIQIAFMCRLCLGVHIVEPST